MLLPEHLERNSQSYAIRPEAGARFVGESTQTMLLFQAFRVEVEQKQQITKA